METLKEKVFTSKKHYEAFCNLLVQFIFSGSKDCSTKNEIALLTLLIKKWDAEHISSPELDPIQLLHSFIKNHRLKAKDLVFALRISKG